MNCALIVEDIAETSRWLTGIVGEAFPGCTVRHARNLRQAQECIAAEGFDLALIDIGLPDGSGLDLVPALRARDRKVMIVVATVMGDDGSIVTALSAGADGYLLKDSPAELFVAQLRQLHSGNPALSPSVARRIMSHFASTACVADAEAELTPRETEVLSLIARGLRNAEVAAALGLTLHTVAGYVKSVYAKLGISSRAEAAQRAIRMGLDRR
jgi:DNA-binding NarL/FixJ family response regulator